MYVCVRVYARVDEASSDLDVDDGDDDNVARGASGSKAPAC